MLFLLLLAACSTPVAEPTLIPATSTSEPPTVTPKPRGKTESGQITSQALANNLVGDSATRRFRVYLPPGYESSDERYPVIFALHGWRGDYEDFYMMSPRLNSLIEEGEARPMIIVYPDGYNAFWGS